MGDIIMKDSNQFIWKENFPPVYGHTSILFLKQCPGFYKAKNGDMEAALTVVDTCAKQDLITKINEKYPDAVLLPIITDNKLPEALAASIGLKVHKEITLCKKVNRKSLSAMERLIHLPIFNGSIKKGESYIIVDDVVTQGGTISALRKYVLSSGGFVAAITALAYSVNSRFIVPSTQDISKLNIKFNRRILSDILRKYNIAEDFGELTKSQIKYLLKFNELGEIISSLEKASVSLHQKGYDISYNDVNIPCNIYNNIYMEQSQYL